MYVCLVASRHYDSSGPVEICLAAFEMASIAATHEQGISSGSIPLADAFVPASIFAPEQGGCGDDDGDECFEDGDMMNGEPEDRGVDFTNKVKLGPVYYGAAKRTLAVHGDE